MTCTLLTHEEWMKTRAPLYTLDVKNDSWGIIQREIITKWIEAHCGAGWVYWDGKDMYVFETLADRTVFKMWIIDDPFEEDECSIEP